MGTKNKFKIKSRKKASTQMWSILGAAMIVVLIVILTIVWFKGSGGKAFDVIDSNLVNLKDCDHDGVFDNVDKCRCESGDANNKEAKGCVGKDAKTCTDEVYSKLCEA